MATVNDPGPPPGLETAPAPAILGAGAPSAPDLTAVPSGGEAKDAGGLGLLMLRVFIENKLALVGVGLVILMVLFSWLGPVFYHTPQGATVQITDSNYLAAPSGAHLLGTDQNGYDQLGRLMIGGQTSIEIALAAALAATLFGVLYGAISGFVGGVLDAVLMRVVDIFLAFPVLINNDSTVGQLLTSPRQLVLPIFTLAVVNIAAFSRYMRSSMMEQMTEDYVRTARAKGLRGRRVIYVHALRNALIPIITLLGLALPGIVAGAVLTESVFNYPGMGLLFYNAIQNLDYPVLIGCTLVLTVATVVGSLLADILYAVADPRIRYG